MNHSGDTLHAEPVRRTEEIEDPTNLYFVHALANRLVPILARLHVHPNAVSLAGMAFGVCAGWAYFHYHDRRCAFAGLALMIAWHVMDGADGQLARLTHTQSAVGKVLDGICDYVTFSAVYVGLALALARQDGGPVILVVIAAGVCHAVQSAAYEAQRQDYDALGWGRGSIARQPNAGSVGMTRVFGSLHLLYARVQSMVAGPDLDCEELERIIASRPERAASIRRRYREMFARPVRRWSVLSANTRTMAIFACAVLGAPLFYFVFEIAGFSLILAALTRRQHARSALFLRDVHDAG